MENYIGIQKKTTLTRIRRTKVKKNIGKNELKIKFG
jgi:hypothetical protein